MMQLSGEIEEAAIIQDIPWWKRMCRIIIPIQGEYYALEGLTQLVDTINIVKKKLNKNLSILGVVLTMFDRRTQLTRQVEEEVSNYFGDKVFKVMTEKDEEKLKGYQYDSLVYRYIRAREQMAEYEYVKDSRKEHDKAYYRLQANRDIMRFCEILNEVMGEHE